MMSYVSASDLSELARDLCRLIKEHQIDEAENRIMAATRRFQDSDVEWRADVISRINKTIKEMERSRQNVEKSIKILTGTELLFAQAKLKPLVDDLFSTEIARLRAEKKRLSRPDHKTMEKAGS